MEKWFGTNTDIPGECSREFILKSFISAGDYGKVYEACKNSNCNFVVKVVDLPDEDSQENFYQEAYISALMGTKDVGPLVYKYWICEWEKHGGKDLGMILMDRLDITLNNYMYQNIQKNINWERIRTLLHVKINTMTKLGYVHDDINLDNIMLTLNGDNSIKDLYLIDWGQVSEIEYSESLVDDILNEVWEYVISLKKYLERISKQGIYHEIGKNLIP